MYENRIIMDECWKVIFLELWFIIKKHLLISINYWKPKYILDKNHKLNLSKVRFFTREDLNKFNYNEDLRINYLELVHYTCRKISRISMNNYPPPFIASIEDVIIETNDIEYDNIEKRVIIKNINSSYSYGYIFHFKPGEECEIFGDSQCKYNITDAFTKYNPITHIFNKPIYMYTNFKPIKITLKGLEICSIKSDFREELSTSTFYTYHKNFKIKYINHHIIYSDNIG